MDKVYTCGLNKWRWTFCDGIAKHGMAFEHFPTEEDLVQAIREDLPRLVVLQGSKVDARDLEARLQADPSTAGVKVLALNLKGADIIDDDDPHGTAAAVMTVFDTMAELNDSNPWMKRPI